MRCNFYVEDAPQPQKPARRVFPYSMNFLKYRKYKFSMHFTSNYLHFPMISGRSYPLHVIFILRDCSSVYLPKWSLEYFTMLTSRILSLISVNGETLLQPQNLPNLTQLIEWQICSVLQAFIHSFKQSWANKAGRMTCLKGRFPRYKQDFCGFLQDYVSCARCACITRRGVAQRSRKYSMNFKLFLCTPKNR